MFKEEIRSSPNLLSGNEMVSKQLLIGLISCGLAACAGNKSSSGDAESTAPDRRSDCISGSSVRGYKVLDDANLVIDAMGRRRYHVTLQRPSFGLSSSWSIAFDSRFGRVCAGSGDLLVSGGGNDHRIRIRIRAIRELSPEEHEDLLIRYGKKEPEIKQTPAPQDVEGADVEELDPTATDVSSGD